MLGPKMFYLTILGIIRILLKNTKSLLPTASLNGFRDKLKNGCSRPKNNSLIILGKI